MGRPKNISKDHRRLAKALKPYNISLEVAKGSGHVNIVQSDKVIWHMSATPKNAHHAIDNTIKDLRRIGAVPPDFSHKL